MTWRPGRVDVLLVLASVLPAWAAMAADLEPEARAADPLAVCLAAVVGLPMLLARRAPVPALVASALLVYGYYLTGYPAIGLALPLAPALYVVADAGRWRTGAALGGGFLAVSSVFRVLSPSEGEDPGLVLGYDGVASLALMAAVLALGDAVRSRRALRAETAERLRRVEEERAAEARRLVAEERTRIARDVHDSVGHAVAVVTLHAAVAAEALDDGDAAAARRSLDTVRAVSRDVLHDLQDTVGLLRDSGSGADVRVAGLVDVPELVAATAATGLDVRLAVEGEPRTLPAAVEATAHRLVQEALTNVLRHADADRASVVIRHGEHGLTVHVTDDGRGCEQPASGHGLLGMRERVALLGGQLLAGNRSGGGFEVRAVLPVAADRVRTPV